MELAMGPSRSPSVGWGNSMTSRTRRPPPRPSRPLSVPASLWRARGAVEAWDFRAAVQMQDRYDEIADAIQEAVDDAADFFLAKRGILVPRSFPADERRFWGNPVRELRAASRREFRRHQLSRLEDRPFGNVTYGAVMQEIYDMRCHHDPSWARWAIEGAAKFVESALRTEGLAREAIGGIRWPVIHSKRWPAHRRRRAPGGRRRRSA